MNEDLALLVYTVVTATLWHRWHEIATRLNTPAPGISAFFIAALWPFIWLYYAIQKLDIWLTQPEFVVEVHKGKNK